MSILAFAASISSAAKVFHFGVGQHFFGIRQVALSQLIVLEYFDHGRQFGVFARELAVVVHVGRGFGLSEEVGDFSSRSLSCCSFSKIDGFIILP